MSLCPDHIAVCICTYKRPDRLPGLLQALDAQETRGRFSFSVVVCDNDARRTGARSVKEAPARLTIRYLVEPRRNIALARNAACAAAKGDFLAFIDDDEVPPTDWLLQLHTACRAHRSSGVLGPVLPRFVETPPAWVARSGLFDRPRWPTGTALSWTHCRTGNVLLRRDALAGGEPPFRARFGEGGEDLDFFRRQLAAGRRYIWCDEAPVHEWIPPARCTRRFLLKRALLRGNIALRHSQGRCRSILKSLAAVPAYAVLLPVLALGDQARFMRCLVRFCDHSGRIAALLRLNPVHRRET